MMSNFIEVHAKNTGGAHFINIKHIVEVIGSTIYLDDALPTTADYSHCDCRESYDEIKALIERSCQ